MIDCRGRTLRFGQEEIRHNSLRSAFGSYSVFLLTYAPRSAHGSLWLFLRKAVRLLKLNGGNALYGIAFVRRWRLLRIHDEIERCRTHSVFAAGASYAVLISNRPTKSRMTDFKRRGSGSSA